MQSFVIEPLAAGSVLEAWPVAHLALPGLDLAAWRRAARLKHGRKRGPEHGRPRSGILVARRVIRRQICGMVWYRAEVDLALGRILRARHLFAIDLLDPAPILTALLNRLGPIALTLNCATIRLATPDNGASLVVPAHANLPLPLQMRLEHWLEISFSADGLSQDEAMSGL